MPTIKIAFRTDHQEFVVGPTPCVVGTLSSLARQVSVKRLEGVCDVVEVRLDKTGQPPHWLARCQEIQASGWPVLLTLRLQDEGGEWDGPDVERWPFYKEALSALAGVDVEWRSKLMPRVAALAKKLRKVCVISYHDFVRTQPLEELASVIREAQKVGSIVKIATRVNEAADEEVLRGLLARRWKRPVCIIGMGPKGTHTRVAFSQLGSCLTYGYLDKKTAPGQVSAAELTRQLRALAGK